MGECPACSTDIAEYLEHLLVDVELKDSIESLKAKDDTATTNETSVKELNGSLEGSAAKRNTKRKEADSTGKLPETSDGRTQRGPKKKNEKVVDEGEAMKKENRAAFIVEGDDLRRSGTGVQLSGGGV